MTQRRDWIVTLPLGNYNAGLSVPGESRVVFCHGNKQLQGVGRNWVRLHEDVFIPEE